MKHYDKLIFVSNSDTCRSPMAEAIMKSKFLLEDLLIESKGLIVLFPEPVNQKAEAVLVSNGLSMKDHTATPLAQEDFDKRTLILTMDEWEKNKIFEEHENAYNVHLLTEYAGSKGDIPNPVGGTLVEYGECFEYLKELISKLVVVLNEEELLC